MAFFTGQQKDRETCLGLPFQYIDDAFADSSWWSAVSWHSPEFFFPIQRHSEDRAHLELPGVQNDGGV